MLTHIIPIAFHSKQIYHPIKKYGGEKIVLILSNCKDQKAKIKINDALANAKKIAKLLGVECEIVRMKNDYDIKERIEKYSKLFEKHERVVVNLTGGPKFDALLLYLIANKYQDKVEDIVYIRDDIEEIMQMPLLLPITKFTDFELALLRYLNQPRSTKELSKLTNKSLPQVLRYIAKLEKKGVVQTKKQGKERIVELKKRFVNLIR